MAETDHNTETICLKEKDELLLTIRKPGDIFTIRLITGSAEIFGSELNRNEDYEFSYFSSISVFTWLGCTLQLKKDGSSNSRYRIKQSSQVLKMTELHERINRIHEDIQIRECPITLIVGPKDAGKSTLSRFLLNRAAKEGRTPVFVDLDVGQNSLSITGSLCVTSICGQSNVYGKFNEQHLSVYYFGYKSPEFNMTLYNRLIEKIGKSLRNRVRNQPYRETYVSEILIDTCGWIDKGGYDLIKHIIGELNVTMVFVLSRKSLYSKLKSDVSRNTEIIYVDKFRDVAYRSQNIRRAHRDMRVSQYFYGSSGNQQMYTTKMNFSDLHIFRDSHDENDLLQTAVPVLIEPSILYKVLAVSYAEDKKEIHDIPLISVFGFVTIVELDMDSKVATILSPRPGPLPAKYLLMGDIAVNPPESF